jgi:peptidoglycan-associated lipoprotein
MTEEREESSMRNPRQAITLLAILLAAVALTAGCGKKPKVATEAPPAQTRVAAEEPAPPPAQPAPSPSVDYANLDPSEYGIEDVFFPYDVHVLSDEAMSVLDKNARIMKEHAAVNYLLEGHCDERGTVEYNLALGEKRAKAAREYLISLGVSGARLRVVSYGEERPFVTGHDERAWSQNRRAHFARP